MSAASLAQLAESYSRIIDSTLKHVRETGLLREAGREAVDELECRWRAAAGKELEAMEARLAQRYGGQTGGSRPSNVAALITGGPSPLCLGQKFSAPASIPEALRHKPASNFAPMTGVTFADPFSLPALSGRPSPPPLKCSDGFGGQREDCLPSLKVVVTPLADARAAPAAAAADEAVQRSSKKARTGQPDINVPLKPPLDSAEPRSSAATTGTTPGAPPLPAAAAAGGDAAEEDDEYDGCFDEADVIISSTTTQPAAGSGQPGEQSGTVVAADAADVPSPAQSEKAPESSDGSELGSDLDDSEFDEPDTENVLYAEVAKVSKGTHKWSMELQRGVLMVDGIECLFSGGRGVFEMDEPAAAEAMDALEDEGAPRGVLADAC